MGKIVWQKLISLTQQSQLAHLRAVLAEHGIIFHEMSRVDTSYPLLFPEIDIFVNAEQLIDAKLLLIENQIE